MCFLPNSHLGEFDRLSCVRTYARIRRYSIFVKAVTHSHSKIEGSLCIFFFLIAVSCTPVAAMCFLPNFAPR